MEGNVKFSGPLNAQPARGAGSKTCGTLAYLRLTALLICVSVNLTLTERGNVFNCAAVRSSKLPMGATRCAGSFSQASCP